MKLKVSSLNEVHQFEADDFQISELGVALVRGEKVVGFFKIYDYVIPVEN